VNMSVILVNQSINIQFLQASLEGSICKSSKQDSSCGDLSIPSDFKSELIQNCLGGTYLLRNKRGKPFAIFKPLDEEPGCSNNPKKISSGKEGVSPGMGAIREYVAYLLDHQNFARVPKTMLIELGLKEGEHTKLGSIQKYVENDGTMDDFGSCLFSVENVQRIAQFDIRTLNMDRHSGNFLVVDSADKELIPIDHTYILPEKLDGSRFDWMYWKQANQPILPVVAQYILNIDLEKEVAMLTQMKI